MIDRLKGLLCKHGYHHFILNKGSGRTFGFVTVRKYHCDRSDGCIATKVTRGIE